MNKLTIIGNLTRDPELRTTVNGTNVCSFTVAVNKRGSKNGNGAQEADYFRVSAWRQLGENAAKWLIKGKKVCVIGPVTVSTYTRQDGTTVPVLEVTADDIEYLSPANHTEQAPTTAPQHVDQQTGYTIDYPEDLPF